MTASLAAAQNAHRQDMGHDKILGICLQQGQRGPGGGKLAQALAIQCREPASGRNELAVQAGKLHPADSGHDIAHMVAPALTLGRPDPRNGLRRNVAGVVRHGKQARVRSQTRGLGVKGHQAAALARGNVFDPVKAEADHVPETADPAAVVLAAKGVGGVFHHAQALASGEIIYLVQLPGVARIINGHDGNGAGCEAFFRVFQIQSAGLGQHVAGHGHAARRANRLKGSHKRQRGHEHLGLAARGAALRGHGVHSQMQGRSAVLTVII